MAYIAEHQVYVTKKRQYHLRRDRCVGVRDLQSGQWLLMHPAVEKHLACVLTRQGERLAVGMRLPQVGDALCFGDDVITSRVQEITEPQTGAYRRYREH